ncbi:MAG: hypothetical protein KAJ46_08960 [Sedimentisphaerales bacterium]|nr:hypothetical protein [Sedimentisphaerales bacterium]
MVNISLVEKAIQDGRRLLSALDDKQINVRAAFWIYDSESEKWRLTLAMPMVDKKGPKESYREVQTVLSDPSAEKLDISLRDVTVVSPENELVKLLRFAIHFEGTGGIVFEGNTINGIYIEKAYIYRMC